MWVDPAAFLCSVLHRRGLDNLDHYIGDQPMTQILYDLATCDLYVSTDFGVFKPSFNFGTYQYAALGAGPGGLPPVAVYGLNLQDSPEIGGDRVLYAATHGRGAWRLTLPAAS